MKILVIPSWYPNPKTKTQGLFFRDQSLALSKKHDVSVIYCHRGKSFYTKKYNDNNLMTYYWGYRLKFGALLGLLTRLIVFISMFMRYFAKNKPDVIHCHSVAFNQDGGGGIAGVILGRLFSIPTIVTEHATIFESKNYGIFEKWLMRWALQHATVVIAVSEGLQRILHDFTDRQDILVIPNTVDTAIFSRAQSTIEVPDKQPVRICSVGYLMTKKGFDRLICLAAVLKEKYKKDIHVRIIGDGPENIHLQQLITENNLSDSVGILGELEKKDIANVMMESDIFILLSRLETFGVVFIEALSTGLYCIGTKCGGPEYILKHDFLGAVLDNSDDISYLSEHVDEVIRSGVYRQSKKERVDYVMDMYSYDSFLLKFDDLVLSKL